MNPITLFGSTYNAGSETKPWLAWKDISLVCKCECVMHRTTIFNVRGVLQFKEDNLFNKLQIVSVLFI